MTIATCVRDAAFSAGFSWQETQQIETEAIFFIY